MNSFTSGHETFYPRADGRIFDSFGTTLQRDVGNPSQPLNQWHLYNASSKAGEWVGRINGQLQRTFPIGAGETSYGITPSYLGRGFNSGFKFAGGIAEVMVYDHVLTGTERRTVSNIWPQNIVWPLRRQRRRSWKDWQSQRRRYH